LRWDTHSDTRRYTGESCLLGHERYCTAMDSRTPDPNDRRRVDAEAMRERDAEVTKMRRAGVPFRAIAELMGISLGAVLRSVRRAKPTDVLTTGESAVVVALVDDELTCDDAACPADVERLNTLELYRLAFVPDLPAEVRAARATAWAALPREPTTYPVSDNASHSWREGVDHALSYDADSDDNW
jgi:hypothetical protein